MNFLHKSAAALLAALLLFFSLPLPALQAQTEKAADRETLSYGTYIKNPKALGFTPDRQLFQAACRTVKSKYVEKIGDRALLEGCRKEVNGLLRQAGKKQTFNPSSLEDVEPQLQRLYAAVDKNLLWYAAAEGALLGAGDPYTFLLTPKEYADMQEQVQGAHFGGIGITVEKAGENRNQLSIFELTEGTPAHRAGLLPGDIITHIDGMAASEISFEGARTKLRGSPGSYVVLAVRRRGQEKPLNFKIRRESIKIRPVSCKLIDGRYGYIKVRTFGEDTAGEFRKALIQLEKRRVKGLIIDLRNNGGGWIDASVDLCSSFIPAGETVVSVAGRDGKPKRYPARPDAYRMQKKPVAILINGHSASASEITAGALQDYKLAVIIGSKSYGKGSVQEIIPLHRGGAFKITVEHYFTPKNRNIDRKGIEPDIKADMDIRLVGKPGDSQLSAAVKHLKNRG